MTKRLNRRLSSVKSLAPCYIAMRVPRSGAYDFTCRCCGEVLQPEKELFQLLHAVTGAAGFESTVADDNPTTILAEIEELRAALKAVS